MLFNNVFLVIYNNKMLVECFAYNIIIHSSFVIIIFIRTHDKLLKITLLQIW